MLVTPCSALSSLALVLAALSDQCRREPVAPTHTVPSTTAAPTAATTDAMVPLVAPSREPNRSIAPPPRDTSTHVASTLRAASALFDAAPRFTATSIDHGLAVCRLRYAAHVVARSSLFERVLAGIATAGFSELAYRNDDADYIAPDLSLYASFGSSLRYRADGPDMRFDATVTVPVESLRAGEPLSMKLVDRDTISADDTLLDLSQRWSGASRITLRQSRARVECRLFDWRHIEQRASGFLHEAERATLTASRRTASLAARITAESGESALLDRSFDTAILQAERALRSASELAQSYPDWPTLVSARRAFDLALEPVARARLARVARRSELGSHDPYDHFVGSSCVHGELRVSVGLRDAPPPSAMIVIDHQGIARSLAVRTQVHRVRGGPAIRSAVGAVRVGDPRSLLCLRAEAVLLRSANGRELWLRRVDDDQ